MNTAHVIAWCEKYCCDGGKPVVLTARERLQLLAMCGESQMGPMGPISGRVVGFLALLHACEAKDKGAPVTVDPDVWRFASPRLRRELRDGNVSWQSSS
jgi:hypothetical protein